MDRIPQDPPEGLPHVDAASVPDEGLILDVRDRADFAAGHAPGAVNVPLSQLPERLADLPRPLGDGPLPVSCGGGRKQTRAVAFLRAHGVDAAALTGGIRGWQAAGRPVVADADRSSPT